MLLAVAQVPPSVQGGVGDQQQAPWAAHARPHSRPGPPLPAPPRGRGVGPSCRRRPARSGPAMLDFAIFAVTFLLILVGAVLYLYPVMAAGPSGPTPAAGSEWPRALSPALLPGLRRGRAGLRSVLGRPCFACSVPRLFRAPMTPFRKAVRLGLWSACAPVRGQNPGVGATLESPVESDG